MAGEIEKCRQKYISANIIGGLLCDGKMLADNIILAASYRR